MLYLSFVYHMMKVDKILRAQLSIFIKLLSFKWMHPLHLKVKASPSPAQLVKAQNETNQPKLIWRKIWLSLVKNHFSTFSCLFSLFAGTLPPALFLFNGFPLFSVLFLYKRQNPLSRENMHFITFESLLELILPICFILIIKLRPWCILKFIATDNILFKLGVYFVIIK